jgi:hypothetical protein
MIKLTEKPVLRIRVRIDFGRLDTDPHWGMRVWIQIQESKTTPKN